MRGKTIAGGLGLTGIHLEGKLRVGKWTWNQVVNTGSAHLINQQFVQLFYIDKIPPAGVGY